MVGLEPGRRTVALMPGSRHSEISRLLPTLLESARILESRKPDLQFLLPVAPGVDPAWLDGPLEQGSPTVLRRHRGDVPEVLTACDAGVVASGTASLETAVAGLPAVVVYRVSPVTHLLGRMLVRLDQIALPNLVAGRAVLHSVGGSDPDSMRAISGRFANPAFNGDVLTTRIWVVGNGGGTAPAGTQDVIYRVLNQDGVVVLDRGHALMSSERWH